MEMTKIHFDMFISLTFINSLHVDKIPVLSDYARQMAGLSKNIYVYEQFFSKMKVVNSKPGSQLDDERYESCLQVATSHIMSK
jgi:hypothetical protein